MLCLWLLTGLVQTCLSGGLYQAAPAPLTNTVEAYGPLARLAVDSLGHLPYHSAAVPVAAVHFPAVADVPVTKYTAHPGYVQKLVDVARAKVATAKLQVRRPAIQKQFYDVEERTVVRPVGSAVLELDEPLSKTLVSPFKVHNTAGHHTVAQFQQPLAYPVAHYPFSSYAPVHAPVQYNPPFIHQLQGVAQYPVLPQQPEPQPQSPQQTPSFPQQQEPQPQAPQQTPSFPQQQPASPFPQPPSFPQPSNPPPDNSLSNPEFDSSDSVVVDNPDFGRSGNQVEEEPEADAETDGIFENFGRRLQQQTGIEIDLQDSERNQVVMALRILDEFQNRQLMRQFMRKNNLQPGQSIQRSQQMQSLQRSQQPQPPQDQQPQRSQQSGQEDSTARLQTQQMSSTESSIGDSYSSELPTLFRSALTPQQNVRSAQIRTYSSQGQIPTVRNLSPEQSQDNQQQLIELLTGRGELSEVAVTRSGGEDSGFVRGRVLSVTPAPRGSEGEERVSTRRVVVSRPIQTLEEVDVHQPFTKIERVAVHEPALLKTAHTHIARVPVVSPTLAPVFYH